MARAEALVDREIKRTRGRIAAARRRVCQVQRLREVLSRCSRIRWLDPILGGEAIDQQPHPGHRQRRDRGRSVVGHRLAGERHRRGPRRGLDLVRPRRVVNRHRLVRLDRRICFLFLSPPRLANAVMAGPLAQLGVFSSVTCSTAVVGYGCQTQPLGGHGATHALLRHFRPQPGGAYWE